MVFGKVKNINMQNNLPFRVRKTQVLLLAAITLIAFPGIGYLIHHYSSDSSFFTLFETQTSILRELGIGAVYGTLAGFTGIVIIDRPFMSSIKNRYVNLFLPYNLNVADVILISICAGVGEEILFRGAIQPHLGIVITAIVFVAIHGYLNPWNWRISVYGVFMTIVIIGIGLLKQKEGLTSAMTAHTFIDIVLLYRLTTRKTHLPENNTGNT